LQRDISACDAGCAAAAAGLSRPQNSFKSLQNTLKNSPSQLFGIYSPQYGTEELPRMLSFTVRICGVVSFLRHVVFCRRWANAAEFSG